MLSWNRSNSYATTSEIERSCNALFSLVASPFGLDKEIKKIRLGVFDFLILRTSGFPNGAGIPFPTRLRIPSKRWANRGRFLWHWCVKLTFARALLRFLLLARKHEVCVGSTNETKNSRSGSFLVPRAEGRHLFYFKRRKDWILER